MSVCFCFLPLLGLLNIYRLPYIKMLVRFKRLFFPLPIQPLSFYMLASTIRQYWQFSIFKNRIYITCTNRIGYRHIRYYTYDHMVFVCIVGCVSSDDTKAIQKPMLACLTV